MNKERNAKQPRNFGQDKYVTWNPGWDSGAHRKRRAAIVVATDISG